MPNPEPAFTTAPITGNVPPAFNSVNRLASSPFLRGTLLLACRLPAAPVNAPEFWVSPGDSDTNSGTREKPPAAVAVVLRQTRELRRLGKIDTNESAQIFLRDELEDLALTPSVICRNLHSQNRKKYAGIPQINRDSKLIKAAAGRL